MRLTISAPGAEKVDVALSRFTEQMRDLRPFWTTAFQDQFYKDQLANFESQGKYVGGWPPLSPRYAAYKSRVRPGRPMMVFNGVLKASLTSPGARYAVFKPQAQSVIIGTSDPKAMAHQLGRGRLPRRQILWLASSQTYGRLAHRWAVQQASTAGLQTTASGIGGVA